MYRLWGFYADMNIDGRVTISDVWLWIKWLYFYPGDLLIAGIAGVTPATAHFFEFNQGSYGGAFSGIVSLLAWFIVYVAIEIQVKSQGS